MPVALLLELLDLGAHLRVRGDLTGSVNCGGDRLHLVPKRYGIIIDIPETARDLVDNIDKLFSTEIGAKTGLRHHVVGELERRSGSDDRVTAMGDIGEGTAMDDR